MNDRALKIFYVVIVVQFLCLAIVWAAGRLPWWLTLILEACMWHCWVRVSEDLRLPAVAPSPKAE
jgi:hypothetical protein